MRAIQADPGVTRASITLLALDARLAAALSVGNLAALHGRIANAAELADELCEVAGSHRALYARTGAEAPWIGYLAQDAGHRGAIGVCGFKDRCRDGLVEIAYATFAAGEGRGYGAAMAAALLDMALAHAEVREVRAHTRPQDSAATAILRHAGFELVGSVQDPQDGEVWRWRIVRTMTAAGA